MKHRTVLTAQVAAEAVYSLSLVGIQKKDVVPIIVRKIVSKKTGNNVRKLREQMLMSKSELAKAAGLSVLTVDRVERGELSRMSTKRKIIKALGLNLLDKERVFQG